MIVAITRIKITTVTSSQQVPKKQASKTIQVISAINLKKDRYRWQWTYEAIDCRQQQYQWQNLASIHFWRITISIWPISQKSNMGLPNAMFTSHSWLPWWIPACRADTVSPIHWERWCALDETKKGELGCERKSLRLKLGFQVQSWLVYGKIGTPPYFS